ncbi:PadR family transcriptional regulator [Paenibacillus arenilitoris]|uniref:PadR family transcriptional regulator n=1 Tax=Paenibacillus arenilitoris TaxID=2772299 RepID=A0A927CJI9_9BACL|nr:PadR family transcriptional regulator [Paenibacillus arenilitoris]MBD2868272.1 PadR family transcriptional regulator [Paenibacillus arenilitoris]
MTNGPTEEQTDQLNNRTDASADGRRGSGKRYFGRGGVKIALLRLLEGEPMHGYQMMKALEERSGGLYVASAGSIYPALQTLEEQGFVSSREEDGGKKTYAITDQGRSALTILPDRSGRDPAAGGLPSPEAEAFRYEKIRRKLGLSQEAIELVQLVTRAERETSASKELSDRLKRLLGDQQQQIRRLLAAGGPGSAAPEGVSG